MKNLAKRKGFKNRHTTPLPKDVSVIKIVTNNTCNKVLICEWKPSLSNVTNYLGCARVLVGKMRGIRFNVWENNNDEFVYYSIIDVK